MALLPIIIATCKYYALYFNLPVVSFLPPPTLLTVVACRCRQHHPNRRFAQYHPIPRRLSANARDVSTACSTNSTLFTGATRDEDTVFVLILCHWRSGSANKNMAVSCNKLSQEQQCLMFAPNVWRHFCPCEACFIITNIKM